MDTKRITLEINSHSFHLIMQELLSEPLSQLRNFKIGMINVFIMHTSASLTINENAGAHGARGIR